MKRIQQMFQLQQSLNNATNGINWEQGMTKNNKKIDWRRCIYLEAAELIDSYPWKHWKNINASPDYANIKIEIVDIWHFIMSEALRIYKINDLGDINKLSEKAVNLPAYQQFSDDHHQADLDIYAEMEKVEEMVAVLFAKADIHQLIDAFFDMSASLNLKLSELYQLYIGKNILNQFRQDHGYKEGSYIKEWHGVEDNVVMQKLLNDKSDITPDELYQGLEKNYPN
jgi:dimeric dUTPase (all-alpha-NTP-PPase superfamily)